MVKITVKEGQTLWDALKEQNIVMERPCGGKGTCGRCSVTLTDGKGVLSCQYHTPGEVWLEQLPGSCAGDFLCVDQVEQIGVEQEYVDLYVDDPTVVLDIGTTTIVGRVFFQGESQSFRVVNPQRQFGADVMSRIQAVKEGRARDLQQVLTKTLFFHIRESFSRLKGWNHAYEPNIRLIVSANTTMQHLLEGNLCEEMGRAPFPPGDISCHDFVFSPEESMTWKGCMLPGISAFVGADIVSGLFYLKLFQKEKPCLFVDLGTNGELALGCKKKLLAASTSAGPAFEGSELAGEIYGSGMIRLIHELRKKGLMDEYGTLVEPYFSKGYPVRNCRLTQDEVRNIQMAKAAVYAGIQVLLESYGITAEEVETVYLAGGFGYFLDPKDALGIGLLQEGFRGKIRAVGNTSLAGAVAYMKNPKEGKTMLEAICKEVELVSLPENRNFETYYIDAMNIV